MYKILYDKQSSFGRYYVVDRIYNDRPSRLLLAGEIGAPQSGLALDDDPELLFDYNQRLLEVTLSLSPQSVLMIGGGAFTLPKATVERLPHTDVDAVEIDPLLPRLARKYFQLPRSRRLKLITRDGRDYIDSCQSRYDLIIVDAFNEYDIPASLLTVEAAAQYARLLAPRGTIAFNIIARYRGSLPTFTHRLVATFRRSFKTIQIYPADTRDDQNEEQNLIFIASHDPAPNLDYLMSVQVHPQILDSSQLEIHD